MNMSHFPPVDVIARTASPVLRLLRSITALAALALLIIVPSSAVAAPNEQAMARAVWMHAMQCEWEIDNAKQKGVTLDANIDVEAVKWNEAESAIEFTLCFTKPKGDLASQIASGGIGATPKTSKEWSYTGKWKAASKGLLSKEWSVTEAAGSFKPTLSPFARPALTRKKIPVQ